MAPQLSDDVHVSLLLPMSDSKRTSAELCDTPEAFFNENGKSYPRCLLLDKEYFTLATLGLVAAEEFNARSNRYIKEFGGLANCTKRLNVKLYDSSFNPAATTKVVLDMILDPNSIPDVAVGASTSSETIPSAMILSAKGVPMVAYWPTSPVLDDLQEFPYFMRTTLPDDIIAMMTCKLWKSWGYGFAGMLFQNDPYGNAYKESIVKHCDAVGIRVASFPFLAGGGVEDIRPQVEQLAAHRVKVFLLVIVQTGFDVVMKEAFRLGICGVGTQWFFSDGVGDNSIRSLPVEVARAVSGSLQIIQVGGVKGAQNFDAIYRDWINMNVSKYASYFPQHWPLPTSIFEDQSRFESTLVKDIGTYLFDAMVTVGLSVCDLFPTENLPSSFGKIFFEHRESIRFEGLSGTVGFDSVGNRAVETATFHITNMFASIDPAGKVVPSNLHVGTYDQATSSWDVFRKPLSNGNSTQAIFAVEVPDHDFQVSSTVTTLCLVMFSIGTLFSLGCIYWMIFYRRNAIVRASQMNFLFLVALGSGISLCSIYFISFDDESIPLDQFDLKSRIALKGIAELDFACNAAVFCFSVGLVLSHTSLLVKAYMIKTLFSKRNFRSTRIPNYVLFTYIGVVVALDLLILLSWFLSQPIVFTRVISERDALGFPLRSAGTCDFSNSSNFLAPLILLHALILLAASHFAFATHSLHTAFAEGKYVGLSIIILVQVAALAAPVIVLSSSSPSLSRFVRSFMVFFANVAVLSLVFLPKIHLSVTHGQNSIRAILVGHYRRGSLKKEKVADTVENSHILSQTTNALSEHRSQSD